MLSWIKTAFKDGPPTVVAPQGDGSVMLITVYTRKGALTVTHKGKTRSAYFSDGTLKKMTKPTQYRQKAILDFCEGLAKLIDSLVES